MSQRTNGNTGSTFSEGEFSGTGLSPCTSCPHAPRTARMALLYLSGMTLEQVGEQFSITRERVRQFLSRDALTRSHLEAAENKRRKRFVAGILTKKERSQWRANYRRQKRLLRDREAIRLYKAGRTLMEVSLLVLGYKHPNTILDILKQHRIPRRRCGPRGGINSPLAKYPWDVWLNGETHEVRRGEHFTCTVHSFCARLYRTGWTYGYRVRTVVNDDCVRFMFSPKERGAATRRTSE